MSIEMTGLADIVRQHAAERPTPPPSSIQEQRHLLRVAVAPLGERHPGAVATRKSYWGDKQRQVN